jgi:NAD(P)H-dependent FMN reductase
MKKIILMAASLRKDSYNKKFIQNAYKILKAEKSDFEIELLSFNDFPMPMLNQDDEVKSGVPDPVKKLGQKISEASAIIFSTPEYNGGIPGTFKNAIDWVSRLKPFPWREKPILLLGASEGALGAIRGLWHTRVPLEALGSVVYPEMFGLPQADKAFNETGELIDAKTQERLKKLVLKFVDFFI